MTEKKKKERVMESGREREKQRGGERRESKTNSGST